MTGADVGAARCHRCVSVRLDKWERGKNDKQGRASFHTKMRCQGKRGTGEIIQQRQDVGMRGGAF